jgi:hypothetical protein
MGHALLAVVQNSVVWAWRGRGKTENSTREARAEPRSVTTMVREARAEPRSVTARVDPGFVAGSGDRKLGSSMIFGSTIAHRIGRSSPGEGRSDQRSDRVGLRVGLSPRVFGPSGLLSSFIGARGWTLLVLRGPRTDAARSSGPADGRCSFSEAREWARSARGQGAGAGLCPEPLCNQAVWPAFGRSR